MDRIKLEQYKAKILIETGCLFFHMFCKMPALEASVFVVQNYVYCNYLLEVLYVMKFLALFMGHSCH